jgi:GNAT superfamily N-acetyltransferase
VGGALPILTEAVADRLERAIVESGAARTAGIAALDGNPLGVTGRPFVGVGCDLVERDVAHYHYFNGPRELRSGDEAVVAPMVEWYRTLGRPLYVRLAPMFANGALLRALAASGLHQTDFMSVMYGLAVEAKDALAPPVEELTAGQRQAFVDLWTRDAPAAERALRERLVEAEFSRGWRCYLARLDGQPVAYGTMFVADNGVGVCAAAATLPAARGRGCQTALLRRRIADAARAGCDLVVVQASPGSGSQRNLQRVGLALAYTRVTWTF